MLPQTKCFIAWLVVFNMRADSSLVAKATQTGDDVAKLQQFLEKYLRILDPTVDNWYEKAEFIKDVIAVEVEVIPVIGPLIARVINLIDTRPNAVDAVHKLRASMQREFVRLQGVVENAIIDLKLYSTLRDFRKHVSTPLKRLRAAVEGYLKLDGTPITSLVNSTLLSLCSEGHSTRTLPYIAQLMSDILTNGCNLSRGSVTHQFHSKLREIRIGFFDRSLTKEKIQQQKKLIESTYKVPVGLMEEYLTEIDRRFSRAEWKWDGEKISNFSSLFSKIESMFDDHKGGTECLVDLAFEKYDYKRVQVGQYALMVMQELETILIALPICHAVLFGKDGESEWGKAYVADIMANVKPVLSQLSEYIPEKWKRDAAKREEVLLNQTLDEWLGKDIDWKEQHGEPTATILSRVADIGMENYKRFVMLLPPAEISYGFWERHEMGWNSGEVKMISVEHPIGWAKIIRTTRHSISTSFDHEVAECIPATSGWLKNNYNNPDAWLKLNVCELKENSFIGASVTTNLFDCDFEGQWASETWDTSDQLIGQVYEFYYPRAGFYWPWCWRMFFSP